MKKQTFHNERGQVLVMIALAAVGLFGFAALAIDGSMVFSDRRHAQNAADTSVLDAALTKTRGGDWVAEGLDRADSNGYDDNGTSNDVYISLCSDADATCTGLPALADPDEYIQVRIRSDVDLFFTRVIGRSKATNYVQAVARAVPSHYDEMFSGNAVVGLNPDDCKSVKYTGSATTTITGSGIFVMSSCPVNAFDGGGHGTLNVPSICAVGGIDPGGLKIPASTTQTEGCTPPPAIVEPNPECTGDATWSGNVMQPGRYTGPFPPKNVDTLMSGIYCIDGDFKLSSATLTGHGVVLRMNDGGIALNGGDEVHLSAPTEGDYAGLLIYMPMADSANCDAVVINGNSDSTITGSILAPCSHIQINGTGASGINGQIIGDTVDIAGNSGTKIHYDAALNFHALTQPEIEFKQ